MNLFSSHLSYETLVDLVDGRIAPDQRAHYQSHLSHCQQCATELNRVQRLLTRMNRDTSRDAPPFAIARALQLFKPLAVAPPERHSWLALLRFDSGLSPMPAVGLRSEQATARQLLYNVNEYDLDLRIEPSGATWSITGQLLGPTARGAVALVSAEQRWQEPLNDLGEFSFSTLAVGEYQLIVTLPEADIAIPSLMLGS